MGRYYNRTGNPVASTLSDGINYVTGTGSVGVALPFGTGQVDMYDFDGSFVVPAGVSEIRISCMGAGGNGATEAGKDSTGGGGGGGFSQGVFLVTPGDVFNYTISNDVNCESGLLTATGGTDGVDESHASPSAACGIGGGTASAIVTYAGGTGGIVESDRIAAAGGGGNGICSYIGQNIPPDGGYTVDGSLEDFVCGGGGVYGGGAMTAVSSELKPEMIGISTGTGFFSNYVAWSMLDKNYYDSTNNGNPGVGGVGVIISNHTTNIGGFGAGGGGQIDSSGAGGAGGVGAGGGGSGVGGAGGAGGKAIILFEY